MNDTNIGQCAICNRRMPLDTDSPHGRCADCLEVAGSDESVTPRRPGRRLMVALSVLWFITGFFVYGGTVVLGDTYASGTLRGVVAVFGFLLTLWMIVGGMVFFRLLDDE